MIIMICVPGFRRLLQPALRAGRTLADLHLGRGLCSGGRDDREVLPLFFKEDYGLNPGTSAVVAVG